MSHPDSCSNHDDYCHEENEGHPPSTTNESLEAEEVYDDDGNLLSVGELVFVPNMEPLGVGSYATVRLAHWQRSTNHRHSIHLNTEDFTNLIRTNSNSNTQDLNTRRSYTKDPRGTPLVSFGDYSVSGDSSKGGPGDDSMSICSSTVKTSPDTIIPQRSRLVPQVVGNFGHFVVRVISTLGSSLLGDPMSMDTTTDEEDDQDKVNHIHPNESVESESKSWNHDQHPRGRLETVDDNRGKLVAVKILSKSILKRMRTLHRNPSTSSPSPSASSSFERLSSSSAISAKPQQHSLSAQSSSSTSNRVHVHTALQRVEQEIALMKLMRHPNIISLQHVIDSPESDALYILLDFAPLGEIMTFDPTTAQFHRRSPDSYSSEEDRSAAYAVEEGVVVPGRYFNEYHAALYFVDVMHGLAYLHQHHVCHRDLKPENIMLEYNKLVGGGVAKITDFGVSHFFEEETGIGARRISWRAPSKTERDHDDACKSSTVMSRSRSRDAALSDSEDPEHMSKNSSPSHRHHPKVLTRYDTDSALRMEGMSKIGRLRQTEGTWCFWSPEMCGLGSNRSSTGIGDTMEDTEEDVKCLPSPLPELKKQKLRRQHSSFSGYASDLWAAGVCLYIFSSGRTPFYSEFPEELFSLIADSQVPYEGLGFSAQLIDLLENVLHKDPDERFGIGECLKHRFCRKARQQRIHSLGEELRRVNEIELIVKAEDILNAFSIAKLTDGAAKMIKEKRRMIQSKMNSDLLGFKRRLESTAPILNEDASNRKIVETASIDTEDNKVVTDLSTSSTSKLLMELGTFSTHQYHDDHEPGNTSCSIH